MRLATWDDRELIESLWVEFLREGTTLFLPTEKTLSAFMNARDNILNGTCIGTVALVEDIAVQMVTELEAQRIFDMRDGKVAQSLGTYVKPEYRGLGLSRLLWATTGKYLANLGFVASFGEAMVDNAKPQEIFKRFGGVLVRQVYRVELQ